MLTVPKRSVAQLPRGLAVRKFYGAQSRWAMKSSSLTEGREAKGGKLQLLFANGFSAPKRTKLHEKYD